MPSWAVSGGAKAGGKGSGKVTNLPRRQLKVSPPPKQQTKVYVRRTGKR